MLKTARSQSVTIATPLVGMVRVRMQIAQHAPDQTILVSWHVIAQQRATAARIGASPTTRKSRAMLYAQRSNRRVFLQKL